ncbi:MAG: hypothetical protein E7425_11900 [Ruminococcaceae bacterium]|nr:hypothetical protein [Oscillospiraceae bacterium]
MVVYWDVAAAWDLLLDYLLLLGTARLAGRCIRRRRLALSAALGAAFSAASLVLSLPEWTLVPALLAMCALAFAGSGRTVRLTLLFALLACSLGGAALLLGRAFGDVRRFARCMLYARMPWGVFFAASALSYVLLSCVFRGGARGDGGERVHVRVEYAGKRADVLLLRDTGNLLTDPLTGEGVPVIERRALASLLALAPPVKQLEAHSACGESTRLDAFRCDQLYADGRALGARLVALSPETFAGRCQGLWFAEREEAGEYGLETAVG